MKNDLLLESKKRREEKKIKCVVWDLDNTVWDGILLEDDRVVLREGVVTIIKTLDGRGILQSIASKNDHEHAIQVVRKFGLEEYFLYPQINWNSKAASIEAIAKSINIGIDTVAFIDDQVFERDEVHSSLPEVLCVDAAHLDSLLDMPEVNPRFITEDSKRRRMMYLSDIQRNKKEEEFIGPKEEFLGTLDMVFTVARAGEDDLKRAEELTVRTHQLNSTGYTYSYEELDQFRKSDQHMLLIAGLDDKYGSYGKIGLALVECKDTVWNIKLLLMSCRVMSRGVGTILVNLIRDEARKKGVRLQAELLPNDRNRMMYITYKFAHFQEVETRDGLAIFANDLTREQPYPEYVKLQTFL